VDQEWGRAVATEVFVEDLSYWSIQKTSYVMRHKSSGFLCSCRTVEGIDGIITGRRCHETETMYRWMLLSGGIGNGRSM